MRVIAGEFRSRRLKTMPGAALRPTPDRLREALFNVLAPHITGVTFLDAYAGCGAVGIEAISRGASRAIFIERHRPAAGIIEENLRGLGVADRAVVICGPARMHLPRVKAEIVFLDPPYDLEREYREALRILGDRPPLLAVVQHPVRLPLEDLYGSLQRVRQVKQGDNLLSFYEPQPARA